MPAKRRTRVESGIYARPDGRLEIGFRDAQGRQRWQVVEGGIAAARRQLTAAKAKRDRGEATATPRLSFNAAADAWLEARVSRLRPATQANYRQQLKPVLAEFGRMKLTAITPSTVAAYVAEMQRQGVKGWTQRARVKVISCVFTYAGRHLGHVGQSPVSLLDRVERPDVGDQREHRILTDAEIAALVATAEDESRLMFAFAVQTGARKGEVLGLSWGDVDTQARTATIDRQLDRQGRRVELKTKGSRRTVAITPHLAAQLAQHRLATGRPAGEALVFTRRDGRPWRHQSADRALARVVHDAGLPHVSWHDLRHAHVSRLFAAGRYPVSIAARVGDSIDTVLRTYAHEFDAARRRAEESDALDAIYGSFMEARGSNRAQQARGDDPADLALARGMRSRAQQGAAD
jgi:integrase